MTQHVDEVEHHHVQVVTLQLGQLLHEALSLCRGVDFVVREGIFPAIAIQLGLDERFFVQVLALFFVFVDPQVGEHLGYLYRHQSREDGVAGILCGGRQNAAIDILVYLEQVTDFPLQHLPLVVAEIVQYHQEYLLAIVEQGKYPVLEQFIGHHRVFAAFL